MHLLHFLKHILISTKNNHILFKNAYSSLCSYFEFEKTSYAFTQQFNSFKLKLHFIIHVPLITLLAKL